MNKRMFIKLLAVLAGAGPIMAHANDPWPSRRVTLVVPWPAGGGTDAIARVVMAKLQERLGQPFVIVNRPGASGIIGTEAVAKAPADGYTFVLGVTNSHAINATFFRKLSYDPVRDFDPVALLATAPHVVLVNRDTPVKTLAEFVQYAKRSHPSLSYASYGLGSTSYLISEYFRKKNGLELLHIPYKGIPPALTALMGKQVSMLISTTGAALPQIEAGRLRPLAVTSAHRLPQLPKVPTMLELGYENAVYSNWYGVFAPAGTNPAIVNKLAEQIRVVLKLPDVQKAFFSQGVDATYMGPGDFGRFVRSEKESWGKLVKLSGATGD
jgi:tripartite-type tricarboxylate transporter receptor subunit TctC